MYGQIVLAVYLLSNQTLDNTTFISYPDTKKFIPQQFIEHLCSDEHENKHCLHCDLYCFEDDID